MARSFHKLTPPKGRGIPENPPNRFERLHVEVEEELLEDLAGSDPEFAVPQPQTRFYGYDSQSILSANDSPDLSFTYSLNPYRGCEHGCSYCYARTYHEYLGFNAGLEFETRILVKPNAPDLLEEALSAPKWVPQTLACSGATDCYQPIERKLEITRGCLEVLARFANPVTIITKSQLVTRDTDLLNQLAFYRASAVFMSITTLDRRLASCLEPRAATPQARLRTIEHLSSEGIPVGVSLAPIIPGLNEHEIPAILEAAADHGAAFATYTILRLPRNMPELFQAWLQRHYPQRAERVLGRIRDISNGALDESAFGARMSGKGTFAEQIRSLFTISARRNGLNRGGFQLSTAFFRHDGGSQLQLF